jgi:hypothetical protein
MRARQLPHREQFMVIGFLYIYQIVVIAAHAAIKIVAMRQLTAPIAA